jgi:hypothetical protein
MSSEVFSRDGRAPAAESETRVTDAPTRPGDNVTIARQLVQHVRTAYRQGTRPARRP